MTQLESQVFLDDCERFLGERAKEALLFDFTFLDPPFNQGKEYRGHDDRLDDGEYWSWMREVCRLTFECSSEGAAMYFMQREKNTENVLRVLRESGWHFQNLIVWRKKTSAIPSEVRYGKAYQVIAFATKGKRSRVFNRLRINPPVPSGYRPRENGIFVTDVWDDIRELTSGYYAGDEALRYDDGGRIHKQQSPIALLLRMILSSTNPGDCVFDPFAGTGTTLVAASQLSRVGVGVEKDTVNYDCIKARLRDVRDADSIIQYRNDYIHTPLLKEIWPDGRVSGSTNELAPMLLN
jgi:DNA modification methylase